MIALDVYRVLFKDQIQTMLRMRIAEAYIVDRIGRVLGVKIDGWISSVLTEKIPECRL